MEKFLVPADALYGAQTQRAVENFPSAGFALRVPSSARWASLKLQPPGSTANWECFPGIWPQPSKRQPNRSLRVITMRSSWSIYSRREVVRQRT